MLAWLLLALPLYAANVPTVPVVVAELNRAVVLPHITADVRMQAFVQRAVELHAPELPAVDQAAPPAQPLMEALRAELSGMDEGAIRNMSFDEVAAVARRVWDNAGTEAPPRYPKVHGALRDYLWNKGYSRTLDAMEFARRYHKGKRKDGLTPEFQHQVEIALFLTTLKDVRNEEVILTAALLHDVVEDYDVTREEIAARFGADVEDVVWRLTKVYQGVKKEPRVYFQEIAESPEASLVKGADRVHNLQSMVGVFSHAKQSEYVEEARRWFLPMLKLARRRFPDQSAAYYNIEHMIKSQVQLIDAALPGKELRAYAGVLSQKAPQARVDLNLERGYLYANRERTPEPETFFGEAIAALKTLYPAGVAVLDTTFAVPGERLFSRNLVDDAAVQRVRDALGSEASYGRMSPAEKAELLFEPFAARLDAAPSPLLFHVDHHYAPELLASASTTPLMVDFLRHLQNTGRFSLIERLQRTFAILDHSDTDITLSHLALRRAHEPGFLEKYGDLMRGAALFNDYVEATSPASLKLYAVGLAVQERVSSGVLRYADALDILAEAARWAAGETVSREAEVTILSEEGETDWKEEQATLRAMTLDEGPAATMAPGTMRRDGHAIVVYLRDGEKAVSTASTLRYLREERPDVLRGAAVILISNTKQGNRFLKMRSFTREDGRYLNLSRPETGLYARFNARGYASAGRHFAGGGAKGGFGALSEERTRALLADVSAAAAEATSLQGLQ